MGLLLNLKRWSAKNMKKIVLDGMSFLSQHIFQNLLNFLRLLLKELYQFGVGIFQARGFVQKVLVLVFQQRDSVSIRGHWGYTSHSTILLFHS